MSLVYWDEDGDEVPLDELRPKDRVKGETLKAVRELAERKRVLGFITVEQERFVSDLVEELEA